MTILLRSLLLWLSLLALPVPGLAAHALPPCHQHVAMQAGAMPMDGMRADAPAAAASQASACAAHDHHGAHDHARCSACAACCAGMALAPPPPPAPSAPGPSSSAIPFRAGHLPNVDPVLPDRPPCPSLA